MSTTMRLTLMGMYNYDDTLFDSLTLPEGYNKNTFINSLLLEHGEKCVLYPDIEFFKFAIGAFSDKWALELSRIYEALTAKYDPTYNYDRFEEYEDEAKRKYKNLSKTDTTERSKQLKDSEFEHKVSAYNSNSYENSELNLTNDGEKQVNNSGIVDDSLGDSVNKVSHKAHLYGNIGVTTATQMINEVLDQRTTRNLYNIATGIFASELLIQIY